MGQVSINCSFGWDYQSANGIGVGAWLSRATTPSCLHKSWLAPNGSSARSHINGIVSAAGTNRAAFEAAMNTSFSTWYAGLDSAHQDLLWECAQAYEAAGIVPCP